MLFLESYALTVTVLVMCLFLFSTVSIFTLTVLSFVLPLPSALIGGALVGVAVTVKAAQAIFRENW